MIHWIRLPVVIGVIAAFSACASTPPDLETEQAALMQASREQEQGRVSAQGDVGYLIEKSRFTFPDADGTWKCVVDVWNNNPPEKTPADTAPG